MKITTLILAFLSWLPAPVIVRAETLAEAAAAAGTDWMIGKWLSEDSIVSISYTWKLDNYAIAVAFKLGDREAEGTIVRKPGTDEVIYVAADNKGGITSGKWIEFNGNPTLVLEHTNAAGEKRKMATEHLKTDADTMTAKLYAVGDDGKPAGSPTREVIFKRQK